MKRGERRRYYSEEDQAKVAVLLQSNAGNVKRTARETGIPPGTVRTWKQKWDENGYPDNLPIAIEEIRKDFIADAIEVRWMMIDNLREKVTRKELNGRELILGIGVLTDKVNVLSGLATSRTEHIETALPDPKELAKVLATFIGHTIDAAIIREEEIEDADFSEQVPKKTLAIVKDNK